MRRHVLRWFRDGIPQHTPRPPTTFEKRAAQRRAARQLAALVVAGNDNARR